MNLLKDLEDIKNGQPVNWSSINKKLFKRLKDDYQLVKQAFSIVKYYNKKTYIISICDHEAFDKIIKLLQPKNKHSRSTASLTGNSHITGVNGALLIIVTEQLSKPYVHVLKKESSIPIPTKKHAVIIENLECFLNFKETYRFMKQFCQVWHDINDIEFIYAAGNSISNQNIIPYLIKFTGDILCIMDIDLGGLQIYKNLLNNGLSITNTHFIIPNDIKNRLKNSQRKTTEEELDKLNKFLNISLSINQLIRLIRYYKTTIEQESYRAE